MTKRRPQMCCAYGAAGPALVVMTRGNKGAVIGLSITGQLTSVDAPAVEVADTVGAGDSFTAGLVSGLLDAGLLGGIQAREHCGPPHSRTSDPRSTAPWPAQRSRCHAPVPTHRTLPRSSCEVFEQADVLPMLQPRPTARSLRWSFDPNPSRPANRIRSSSK